MALNLISKKDLEDFKGYILVEKNFSSNIIKAFIDLTSYFTIGAFDKILSEQDSFINNREISTIFNDDKELENATDKLSEEESVFNFKEFTDIPICIKYRWASCSRKTFR